MNTPPKDQRQPSDRSDNEMPSSPKEKYAHETVDRDIIEGYKKGQGSNRIGASIMSPEKTKADFETHSRDPVEAQAGGMTLSPERIREGGTGMAVADALNGMRAVNEAQRDRQKRADVNNAVVENVFIGHEKLAKTKLVVVAMTNAIAGTRVSLDARDHQYARKAALLQVDFDCTYGNEEDRWTEVLGPYAPSANSFYLMRPAICWQKKREISETLRHLSALHGSSELKVLKALMTQLAQQRKTLDLLENLKRADVLEAVGGKTRRPQSLRDDLSALPAGWQAKIVERAQASERYADAVAILALTGCRPDELVQGVSVHLDTELAVIRILGAKIGDHAGQPWREIEIPKAKLPAHLLLSLRERDGAVQVRVKSTDALRQAVYSYSRQLWLGGTLISPYHFRHSMAETLRENGWPAHEIAGALGERSAATVSHYGRKIRPKRSGRREVPEVLIVRGAVRTAITVPPLPVFMTFSIGTGIKGRPS
ncbi:MAG: site-specific integrase [Burkholderiaceae bacterium]|nr:site-specific integrase [Burkholderiaceae bacterium]